MYVLKQTVEGDERFASTGLFKLDYPGPNPLGRSISSGGSFDPGSSLWNVTFRVLDELDRLHCVLCSLHLAHTVVKTSSQNNRRRSRARKLHGSNAEMPRGLLDQNCNPLWLSGRYFGSGSHCRYASRDLCGLV